MGMVLLFLFLFCFSFILHVSFIIVLAIDMIVTYHKEKKYEGILKEFLLPEVFVKLTCLNYCEF